MGRKRYNNYVSTNPGGSLCCQLASANPGTGKFSVPVPVKSTGVQFVLVLPQDEKSWKMPIYRVLDPGFTMHACHAARDSTCMHARMSWPAVLKELLAAKYARVAPRCQTVWPFCWPQTALRQQRPSCSLCKTEPTPKVPRLKQALLSRF